MTTRIARSERMVLGALSALSGACLLLAPESMASLYGLPQRTWLARTLGVRDIAIGLELCTETRPSSASLLRALSDTFDAGLIAGEAMHAGTRARDAGVRVLGAALLAMYARLLHERLRYPPGPPGGTGRAAASALHLPAVRGLRSP